MDKSVSKIIPGAYRVVNSLRIALFIIAIFILFGNILIESTCHVFWVKDLANIASLVNVLYIFALLKTTKIRSQNTNTHYHRFVAFTLLLVASIPCLVMLLCGGDYMLYEILGVYIMQDTEKMIFPLACIFFLVITYWMPITMIDKIQNKVDKYLKIKYSYVK